MTMLVQLAGAGCGVFRVGLVGLSKVEVPFFFTLSSSVGMAWKKDRPPVSQPPSGIDEKKA